MEMETFQCGEFARALLIWLLAHSPLMLYDHTVHMSNFGRSGTVLDTPNTLVSILNLTTIYCIDLSGLRALACSGQKG